MIKASELELNLLTNEEYIIALLTTMIADGATPNMSNEDKITFFLESARRMYQTVPDDGEDLEAKRDAK